MEVEYTGDQECKTDEKVQCFFQCEQTDTKESEECFIFSGNNAGRGGDAIFGGCLTNCLLKHNDTFEVINVKNGSNIFWNITLSRNSPSQSIFAEYSTKVVFCDNQSNITNAQLTIFHAIRSTR